MQALAQSLNAADAAAQQVASSATSTDTPSDVAGGKSSDDDTTSSSDPSAIALALASQSLAAALGLTPPPAPVAATTSGAQGDAPVDGPVDGVGSAISGGKGSQQSGSSMQDLVSLLAEDASQLTQDDAGDAKAKSGADAPQTDAAGKAGAMDGSNTAANSSSSAQLGLASHFGVQHARTDSNTVTADLRAPVGTGAWNDELGGQVTWMAHQGIESASLRLSPEHLGPVEVHISVHNSEATVWFGASQPDTRAALEQALPRLRQMFASQGLTLADSGVSRESPRQQGRTASTQGISAVSSVGSTDAPASSAMRLSLGLVDTYA